MSKLYHVEEDGTVIVTTASGWEVECQPVTRLLLRVGQNLVEPESPEIPMYTVVGAGDEEQERAYDQAAIDDPKTPDKDRAKWAVYLKQKTAYDAKMESIETQRNEMRGRFMALRGIKVRGLPSDLENWAEGQSALYGFEIADDGLPHHLALRLAFIDNEVIHTEIDGGKVTAGIMYASGLAQEALDAVESTFLDQMGHRNGANTERDTSVPSEKG